MELTRESWTEVRLGAPRAHHRTSNLANAPPAPYPRAGEGLAPSRIDAAIAILDSP